MSAVKEPGFFSADSYYRRGIDYYSRTFFRGADSFAARGEATPFYLHNERAPERIEADLPPESHRFVAILRDPVDRAYSMYWSMVRTGVETGTFEEGLAAEQDRLRDPAVRRDGSLNVGYVHCGRYAQHLGRWTAHFGAHRLLVLFHEDLRDDPSAVVRRVFAFLGVEDSAVIDVSRRLNEATDVRFPTLRRLPELVPAATRTARVVLPDSLWLRLNQFIDEKNRKPASYVPMRETTRSRLRALFADDVVELERMTGRDLSQWRTEPGGS